MKLFCVLLSLALIGTASAGTETRSGKEVIRTKEMKQALAEEAPCPEWYANNEWEVSLWGAYAFTGENWRNDRYIEADHAWGGGVDVKYFFARYFGIGAEGFLL